MLEDILEIQDLYSKKDDIWKKNEIKNFINISVKCIFLGIFKEIVKNRDLYMKKDDFWKNLETIYFYFFYLKDFMFCKYVCKMYKLCNIRFSKKSVT